MAWQIVVHNPLNDAWMTFGPPLGTCDAMKSMMYVARMAKPGMDAYAIERESYPALDQVVRELQAGSYEALASLYSPQMEQARTQIELGAPADHDRPYHFQATLYGHALGTWLRLMKTAEAGCPVCGLTPVDRVVVPGAEGACPECGGLTWTAAEAVASKQEERQPGWQQRALATWQRLWQRWTPPAQPHEAHEEMPERAMQWSDKALEDVPRGFDIFS